MELVRARRGRGGRGEQVDGIVCMYVCMYGWM